VKDSIPDQGNAATNDEATTPRKNATRGSIGWKKKRGYQKRKITKWAGRLRKVYVMVVEEANCMAINATKDAKAFITDREARYDKDWKDCNGPFA
jgi:hypothetical protein